MKKKFAAIFCALFRHSHLTTNCMGYKYCARCDAQLGDSLAGVGLPVPPYFQIGQLCQCEKCKESFDSLNWIDRFMVKEKAVWPTDEIVKKAKKEKFELLAALKESRIARESIRIAIVAAIICASWLVRPIPKNSLKYENENSGNGVADGNEFLIRNVAGWEDLAH